MFQHSARLEVSGIFDDKKGTEFNLRFKGKKIQTTKSDITLLPAYVVIVEFKTPKAKYGKRGN